MDIFSRVKNFFIPHGHIFPDDPNSNFSCGQIFADACTYRQFFFFHWNIRMKQSMRIKYSYQNYNKWNSQQKKEVSDFFYYLPLSQTFELRKNIKDFAESHFRENDQNQRNPRKFIHAKIYLLKVDDIYTRICDLLHASNMLRADLYHHHCCSRDYF